MENAKPVRLVTSLSSGLYAPPRGNQPGHLMWVRDEELFAQPLDIDAGRLIGDVTSVASDVSVEESQRGTLQVCPTRDARLGRRARREMRFAWYHRNGNRLGAVPVPQAR